MSKRIPIFLGMLLILIAIWLLITPNNTVRLLVERLNYIGYDLQLRTRILTEHFTPETPVAIIDIDDKSLKAEGRWPWPRSKLATLVNQLKQQGAAVIAFDIFFSEKENNLVENLLETLKKKNLLSQNPALITLLKNSQSYFDEDIIFAKSLADSQTILPIGFLPRKETQNTLPKPLMTLTSTQEKELAITQGLGYISNIPVLQQAATGSGFINIFPDVDGIIRHSPLIMRYNNDVYPSLALQAVLTFLGDNVQLITPLYDESIQLEGLQLGTHYIPTDAKGQIFIPFIGKSYTFPYYSAIDILHGKLPKDSIAGKILFIGTSATGLGDLHATAVQNPFPGVELQATIANGILLNQFSYKPAWTYGASFFVTILFGLIAACLFPYLGPRTLSAIIIFFPPILIFANNWFWQRSGLVLSFLIPLLLVLSIAFLNMIYGYLFETRKRERLKEMFGQYVPETHIDEMLRTTSNYGLRGEDREMSVLFADIRQFTTISEGMTASELVELLNTFFTPMTEIIFKHRGTIDKYVGDLIMAFWGAPLKDKNHARHAIESALDMQKKLKNIQPIFAEHKWPVIQIGIGINSGIMSVGDMGSRYRRNYTVLGDAVNLSSRVESLTKFYGVNIIVTEHTQKNQSKFIFRKLDHVRVKGKKHGIDIFEVICAQSDLTPELNQELDLYHQAINFYFQERFNDALTLMEQLYRIHPETKLYQIYLARINEFIQNPPQAWDGIFVHHEK